jgi:hypothetical protein
LHGIICPIHHGFKSLGPALEAIQDATTSTRRFKSLDASARRTFVESTPNELPTSLATDSHGVPTVRLVNISLPRFTASAIAGGTSGRACKIEMTSKLLSLMDPTGTALTDSEDAFEVYIVISHGYLF